MPTDAFEATEKEPAEIGLVFPLSQFLYLLMAKLYWTFRIVAALKDSYVSVEGKV